MKLAYTDLARPTWALALLLALPGLALAQIQPGSPTPPVPPAALPALTALARAQGLSAADVADPLVTDSYYDATMGLTHTYFQQRVNGLTVYNATGAVHTDKAGKAVASTQRFVAGAAASAPSPTPTLSPEAAVAAASVILGLPRPLGLQRTVEARQADGIIFNRGGISEQDIPVQLVYARQADGKLVLAWRVTIAQLDQQHHYDVRLDARTGRLVDRSDYVVEERASFGPQALGAQARRRALLPAVTQPAARPPFGLATPAAALGAAGVANSLTVVAMPGENPLVSPRVNVPLPGATPWSPYGWQVGQGLAPSGFFADSYSLLSSGRQLTRGNNVAAYNDFTTTNSGILGPNLGVASASTDGGNSLSFDFPFDPAKGARDEDNIAAANTNLFYWNNVVHDVMMAHGFDEVSGNFQYKNLTSQGLGNDFVRAEAQDGSGLNNANFSTPADGQSGRMQMYLFDNVSLNVLTISAPAAAAGTYSFGRAAFGARFVTLPNGFNGTIVAVNDGVSPDGGVSSCATPYVNAAAMQGNIALIKRGGCTGSVSNNFVDKVKLAQDNGAVGAIIYDSNVAGTAPLTPGGTDSPATITIPVIGISGVAGARIRAALTGSTTGTVSAATVGAENDGSFDSGVMTHEYGHGISNRLTGGPSVVTCLSNTAGNQLGGEGWSDFFGLWMTTKPGDDGGTNRYIGTYDNGQPIATGPGFRIKPYSTNFSAAGNNYTYAQLGTGMGQASLTHAVGEVWCSVLWDLNWQLIYKYGYNPDFYALTGGNNLSLKLVLDGCKLQPCNPNFLDARDAILSADAQSNGGANTALIWTVFARRGMGFGAKAGDVAAGVPQVTGVVEAFDLPPGITPVVLAARNGVTTASTLEAYPNPAQDELLVRAPLTSSTPVQVALLDALGRTVLRATGSGVLFQQAGVSLRTAGLANGVYVVRVTTSGGIYTTRVTVQH